MTIIIINQVRERGKKKLDIKERKIIARQYHNVDHNKPRKRIRTKGVRYQRERERKNN